MINNVFRRRVCAWGWVAALMGILLAGSAARAGDFIWIEGEAAQSRTTTPHPWWYDKVKRDQLSGGSFISHWNDKQMGEAAYVVNSPRAQNYVFWVRANPVGTRLSYQLDDGAWTLIDMKAPVETINIAEDGKIDLRFIAWVKVGNVKLAKGSHRVAFQMHSENNNHGLLDCFVFGLFSRCMCVCSSLLMKFLPLICRQREAFYLTNLV